MASNGFRLGKLFHLTPLVDSLGDAEFFFNSVFSPVCMMRNYSPHWHRDAVMYAIADMSVEPMQPLAPPDGQEGTSWYRYMARFGPHVHNIAFYVDDAPALARRLEAAGVRTTDGGGSDTTVFAHPKDTPGMLEFSQPTGETFSWLMNDPRFSDYWSAWRDDFWPKRHGLGLERLSHITVVVRDVDAARGFYTDVLDADPLPRQEATVPDADAAFVRVGDDTILELVHPHDESSVLGQELATVGQSVTGVTFKVRDAAKAAAHLRAQQAPVAFADEREVALDRARTWNTDFRFTTRVVEGDPR